LQSTAKGIIYLILINKNAKGEKVRQPHAPLKVLRERFSKKLAYMIQ
jgi:hypothetical protein